MLLLVQYFPVVCLLMYSYLLIKCYIIICLFIVLIYYYIYVLYLVVWRKVRNKSCGRNLYTKDEVCGLKGS